jgi:hypothetical protein
MAMSLRAYLVVGVLAMAGCGGAEEPRGGGVSIVDPGPPPASTPSPVVANPAAPLSGNDSTDTVVARRAVAVPVRVGPGSPAPAGLAEADILYQEYAESGSLRFVAVYQSRDVPRIGPVTEIRPADVKTLTALGPVVGYGGGPTGFVSQLTNSKLPAVTQPNGGYTSTATLYKAAPAGTPPPSIFVYAEPGEPLAEGAKPATRLSVTAPSRSAQVWQYDEPSRTWRGQVGGVTVAVSSVVVLTMEYKLVSVRNPSPRDLPSATVLGEGAAVAVSGGQGATGTWVKPGLKMVSHVVDSLGYQVRLRPGTTWVVYAPLGSTVTTS